MIFNEVYSAYYKAVKEMIKYAAKNELNKELIYKIINEVAFEESSLSIVPSIEKEEWQVITSELKTPIKNDPSLCLTGIERAWIKTVLKDPRAVLFNSEKETKEKISDEEILFSEEDTVFFDRYTDGDDYASEEYIANFKTVLRALKEKKKLRISFISGKGQVKKGLYTPIKIEYSDKEDKFRLICKANGTLYTVNIARIVNCGLSNESFSDKVKVLELSLKTVVFDIINERKTLERAMMKFSHYKKEVEKIGDNTYRVVLEYDKYEETDMLIQLMSFGSYINVISPIKIKKEISKRLKRQIEIFEW
jgi:hypothetical protein